MKVIVTPEQMMALKDLSTFGFDGRFDEGRWIDGVRNILGDEVVGTAGRGGFEVEVDWNRHGAVPIRVHGVLGWSAISHTSGYCERCDRTFTD